MPASQRGRPGVLVIIGGAEDKLGAKSILSRFTRLAGGDRARIAVLSTASSLGEAATELYRSLFGRLGAADVLGVRPMTRREADSPALAAALESATGIFMTGGNQLKLAMVVGGTGLGRAIKAAHARGAVVGGTSAGASAISSHMVAFGASGEVPKQRMAQLSAGLGLLPDVIVDQHFQQRNRIGRLLSLVAQSPSQLGLGIDEDTAAVVTPDRVLEVSGKGVVTLVDGRHLQSDAFEGRRSHQMLVSGAVLHSLPNGYRFDLDSRRLLPYLQPVELGESLSPAWQQPPDPRLVRRVASEGVGGPAERRRNQRARREEEASQ